MDVAVAFPFGNSFNILFSVTIYSHANECSVCFIVFESTVTCCGFFLYLVLSCHVYAIICFTIYNVGEGPYLML